MIALFAILSVFAVVQMVILGSFEGLDFLGDKVSFYATTSFGNIGFSQSICGNNIIEWHNPADV